MNLFLYDFLEFTRILHRNFFFGNNFFQERLSLEFFFLEINFQTKAPLAPPWSVLKAPLGPPLARREAPLHLPQFRGPPSTKTLEGGLEGGRPAPHRKSH